jgi:twinkle protein
MTMNDDLLTRASRVLAFDPSFLDPERDPILWVCDRPEDVQARELNAVCLGLGKKPEDFTAVREFLEGWDFLFVPVPNQERRKVLTDALQKAVPNRPIWVPASDAFQGCSTLREFRDRTTMTELEDLTLKAVELPAYGIIRLADVETPERKCCARSGIRDLDQAIGGFGEGELSVWTGKRGEGKSTLLSQILLEAVDQGKSVFAYSGELPAWQFKHWAMVQAAGPEHITPVTDPDTGHRDYSVNALTQKSIDAWWRDRYFLYDLSIASAHSEESVLSLMDASFLRYGCRVFLVDNSMTMQFRPSGDKDYYRAQSAFVGRLAEFAKRRSVHVHLVSHPRKVEEGKHLTVDDVGGSGDIGNRADNAFAVERVPEEQAEKTGFAAGLRVLKNRQYGSRAKVRLTFDPACRRFSDLEGFLGKKQYGWDETPQQTTFQELEATQTQDLPF